MEGGQPPEEHTTEGAELPDPSQSANALLFASMVAPSAIGGKVQARLELETSALDAFLRDLLDALKKLSSDVAQNRAEQAKLREDLQAGQETLREQCQTLKEAVEKVTEDVKELQGLNGRLDNAEGLISQIQEKNEADHTAMDQRITELEQMGQTEPAVSAPKPEISTPAAEPEPRSESRAMSRASTSHGHGPSDLLQRLEGLESGMQQAAQESRSLRANQSELQAEMDSSAQAIKDLQEKIRSLKARASTTAAKTDAAEGDKNEAAAVQNTDTSEEASEVPVLSGRDDTEALSNDVESLKELVKDLEKKVKKTEGKVSDIKNDLDDEKALTSDMKSDIGEMRHDVDDVTSKMSQLERKLLTAEGKIERAMKRNANQPAAHAVVEVAPGPAGDKPEGEQNPASTGPKEYGSTTDVSVNSDDLDEMREQMTQLEARFDELERKQKSNEGRSERALKGLTSDLKRLQERAESSSAARPSSAPHGAELEMAQRELGKSLKSVKSEVDSMKKSINVLESGVHALRGQSGAKNQTTARAASPQLPRKGAAQPLPTIHDDGELRALISAMQDQITEEVRHLNARIQALQNSRAAPDVDSKESRQDRRQSSGQNFKDDSKVDEALRRCERNAVDLEALNELFKKLLASVDDTMKKKADQKDLEEKVDRDELRKILGQITSEWADQIYKTYDQIKDLKKSIKHVDGGRSAAGIQKCLSCRRPIPAPRNMLYWSRPSLDPALNLNQDGRVYRVTKEHEIPILPAGRPATSTAVVRQLGSRSPLPETASNLAVAEEETLPPVDDHSSKPFELPPVAK